MILCPICLVAISGGGRLGTQNYIHLGEIQRIQRKLSKCIEVPDRYLWMDTIYDCFFSASSVSRSHTSKLCPHPPQTILHLSDVRDLRSFS